MRTYTQKEKQAVIDRVISGEPSAHILADTDIPKSTFYSWVRIYREEQNAANKRTVDIRNFHLLENKVTRLESIVEILKSATCTPKSPLRQRLYAAEQLYGRYNVHAICDAFDIPRGTFYNHVLRNKKDNTWYAKRREEFKVSNEMVRTLMRDMGLFSIRQSAKKLYEDEGRKYPYLKKHPAKSRLSNPSPQISCKKTSRTKCGMFFWRRKRDSNPRAQWANGFQDRLVMTTSIFLHKYIRQRRNITQR